MLLAVLLLVGAAACGGDDSGDETDAVAEAEPISVDPCSLLDATTAADLAGAESVELVDGYGRALIGGRRLI